MPYRTRTTGDCIPARSQDEDHYPAVLEGKGGGYPSPTRGVTWPSEGDDVMNEGGSAAQGKAAYFVTQGRVDRVYV